MKIIEMYKIKAINYGQNLSNNKLNDILSQVGSFLI